MSEQLHERLFDELEQLPLIDPHTHINPHAAASSTLADILGYHYYTELAHSAGLPREQIEEPGLEPRELVGRLAPFLDHLDNTVQVSWLVEMCREFFGFDGDRIGAANWESVYDAALETMSSEDWEDTVLEKSGLEQVYLTNDFDDPLDGFDTSRYVPCLRTDDLVFHLGREATRERFEKSTGVAISDSSSLKSGLSRLFEHFTSRGARACAISLPPDFTPSTPDVVAADAALSRIDGDTEWTCDEATAVSRLVFWTLSQACADFDLPFDLMIGVNRRVYPDGVYQGQDLFDKRTSLKQYGELFSAFPGVTFPVSVLSSTSNQELVSYSWIFPNVVTNGHWWYSNIPAYIETDCRSRLQAVPRHKQIGYYSDMYKLEFALPKFRMYRRILARVLATDFVIGQGWSETRALDLGRQVLRGNVETIFGGVS
ncbi:glucuronate isomerase [Planctomycetaceae bacterium]|nr:glucuronate isomerase [Planctomycetaceae bacterium]